MKLIDRVKACKLPTRTVNVPEWGGDVIVRSLTSPERDEFDLLVTEASEQKRYSKLMVKVIIMATIDDDGNQAFTDDDTDALLAQDRDLIERVFNEVRRVSRLLISDVDEAEKNSDGEASD